MIRTQKTIFGLAIVATLVSMALLTSGASAQIEFESETGTATVKGNQVGTDVFTTTYGKVECTTINYHGTISGTALPEFELSPEYSGCSAFGFTNGGQITTNGCTYRFYSGETVGGVRKGSADVVCPIEKAIVIHAALFGTDKCTVTVGPQTGLEGVVYKNEGTGTTRDIKVELELSGIHYEESAGTGFGACSTGTATNGAYKGVATVKGYGSGGGHKGFWIDRKVQELEFESETGTATVKGSQVGTDLLTTTSEEVSCTTINYHGMISGTSLPELELAPEYAECTSTGFGAVAQITTNGCTYRLYSGATVAGIRKGSADIVCPKGKAIVLHRAAFGTNKCTVTVTPQSGLEGVVYENEATGTTRDLKVELELSGIHYEEVAGTGFGACSSGTAANGTYKGAITLKGYDAEGGHKGFWNDP